MVYFYNLNVDPAINEEFWYIEPLKIDSKDSTIFKTVEYFFYGRIIFFTNIITCATDNAPSMICRHCQLSSYYKKAVPNIFTIRCIIHREHLARKHLSGR